MLRISGETTRSSVALRAFIDAGEVTGAYGQPCGSLAR